MTPYQQEAHDKKINFWRPHVDAWQHSKMTAKQYCEQQSLNPAQFKYWQYQIAPHTKQSSKARASTSFTEITPRVLSSLSLHLLELVLPNGYVLKIPAGYEVSQLMVIIKNVRALTC